MKRAFTLIEVNLAVLVMAGGILSVIVLYSLGYRETRQCREDLVSTAYSDAVLDPIVAKLSDPKLTWEEFNKFTTTPAHGWGDFLDSNGKVVINTEANNLFSGLNLPKSMGNKPCYTGLVLFHDTGSGVIKLGFRMSAKREELLSAPLYYTEVRFQGGF